MTLVERERVASDARERRRVWVVGEHNPYRPGEQRYALYPFPKRATGARLAAFLGLTAREFVARFNRRNLLDALPWSAPRAREAARLIAEESAGEPLVLLGAKVAAAFGYATTPFVVHDEPFRCVAVLPHPSGLSRAWNAPGAADKARACVWRVAGWRDDDGEREAGETSGSGGGEACGRGGAGEGGGAARHRAAGVRAFLSERPAEVPAEDEPALPAGGGGDEARGAAAPGARRVCAGGGPGDGVGRGACGGEPGRGGERPPGGVAAREVEVAGPAQLVVVPADAPVWDGPLAFREAKGAFVRLEPPAGAHPGRVAEVKAALRGAGAAAVALGARPRPLVLVPGGGVLVVDPPAPDAVNGPPGTLARAAALALVDEANTQDRDALRAAVEEALGAGGL